MKKRNTAIRKKCFERDVFICQKCKIQDLSTKKLEAHHIIPLVFGGKDELGNLITLCSDCHHFAPNKKEDYDKYLKEECGGTMTTFFKALKIVQDKNPELFK